MKSKALHLFLLLLVFAAGVFASAPIARISILAPIYSSDREKLIAEYRRLANDDTPWVWIEYYEVGDTSAPRDYYLSQFNFERMKATRRDAYLSAAKILEDFAPPSTPAP